MATSALEEKINKIKLKNEEIKRRYEEVEADKKNAAKLNALVQMVPSTDWPERKEPLDFTRKETIKSKSKPKSIKEHSERPLQYQIGGAEGKKIHKFSQGDGPPPDPKYNFLADSEREENNFEGVKDEDKSNGPNKRNRNGPRKRGGARDGYQKDHRGLSTVTRDRPLPEYDAWRAERNRIDEARISRQRTAEGNWRREWDSDKTSMEKDSRLRFSSNDTNRRDHKEFERRHHFEGDHPNRSSGSNFHISHGPKNTHSHYDNQHYDYSNEYSKAPVEELLSPTDDRTVIATDKSLKVTLNQEVTPLKRSVLSVKVNAPSIAGTGRVGPRQKTRVTYSSQSEVEVTNHRTEHFLRQKSFDEKVLFNNVQRSSAPKSPCATRKKESGIKSPYPQRKDMRKDERSNRPQKREENIAKSSYPPKKEFKDIQKISHLQKRSHTTIGSISPRAQAQNRLNQANSTVIKNLAQSTSNNKSAIEQSREITVDKCVEVGNDKIIKKINFPKKNSQIEIRSNNKDMNKKIEKTDVKNTNIEPVNVEFSELINEKMLKNESIDLLELEKKELKKSKDISFNQKIVTSESNFLNEVCEKSDTENEINSEKNPKVLLSSETDSLEISKDTQKKFHPTEILEENQSLDTKKMVSMDKNLEEVREEKMLENVEMINNDERREHLVESPSKIESSKFESEDNSQVVSEVKIKEIVKDDILKNSCVDHLVVSQSSSIESQSENLIARIPN